MDSVFWTLTGAVITVILAVLNWATSVREAKTWDKRVYQWALLLAVIFTAYGSWRAFLISEYNKWDQADVQFRNEWLQRQQLKERLLYEKQLRAKADEIASLNREIAAGITGGDNYPFLLFSLGDGKTNEPLLVLNDKGRFPLYDVSVEITDSEKFEAVVKALRLPRGLVTVTPDQLREFNKAKVTFPPRNLRPEQGVILRNSWSLPADRETVNYTV